jgi:hypothetical protein
MSTRSELSSVATGLDDLVSRVTRIAEALATVPEDTLADDLFEVERTLRAAQRRLARVLDR